MPKGPNGEKHAAATVTITVPNDTQSWLRESAQGAKWFFRQTINLGGATVDAPASSCFVVGGGKGIRAHF